MEKETPVLDVHAANRYLYTQEDMRNILLTASNAAENSVATVTVEGSAKPNYVKYTGSFQVFMDDVLEAKATESPNFEISAAYPEITLERRPGAVLITAGQRTYSAPIDLGGLGINKEAAPYKATFKPLATRYELNPEEVQSFKDTISRLYKPDCVYKVGGSIETPEYGYMTPEALLHYAGINPLKYGGAVCKHKNIKVFKLDNGLGFKLGNTALISITEASPRYKNNTEVFVKQQDPYTHEMYFEPVKVKVSKGFNPTFRQYAYDVITEDGKTINDVPEADIVTHKVELECIDDNTVPTSHF